MGWLLSSAVGGRNSVGALLLLALKINSGLASLGAVFAAFMSITGFTLTPFADRIPEAW